MSRMGISAKLINIKKLHPGAKKEAKPSVHPAFYDEDEEYEFDEKSEKAAVPEKPPAAVVRGGKKSGFAMHSNTYGGVSGNRLMDGM